MTTDELRDILAILGLSQREFARAIGRGEGTVRGMCRGRKPIDDEAVAWLRDAMKADRDRNCLTSDERSELGELLG